MNQHPRSRPLCRKVYVGGLGNNGTVHELRSAFCCYGPVKKVWVARNPPGFAFVEFHNTEDAQNAIIALDGTILCGRRVRVAFANRNSRSSSGGQSRNAPTRNGIQGNCYACGEIGHYARDCIAQRVAMLDLEDDWELDYSYFDSDDEMDMLQELYDMQGDGLYEYLQAYFDQHDDSSSNSSHESSNQSSRNSAEQQHRNERPQEQHRSDRSQEQHGSDRSREEHGNVRSQERHRNNRSQEQSRNDRPQGQYRNNQSQEQHKSNSAPSCSPASCKTNNASDEVKCAICLDTVEDEMKYIPCGHGFHAKCCNEWLSINGICPVCRSEVGSRIGIDPALPRFAQSPDFLLQFLLNISDTF